MRARVLLQLKVLLEHGADANLRSHGHGWTPLHEAAAAGWTQAVRLLLEAGADAECRTEEGSDAENLAHACGHLELAALLPDLTMRVAGEKRPDARPY